MASSGIESGPKEVSMKTIRMTATVVMTMRMMDLFHTTNVMMATSEIIEMDRKRRSGGRRALAGEAAKGSCSD